MVSKMTSTVAISLLVLACNKGQKKNSNDSDSAGGPSTEQRDDGDPNNEGANDPANNGQPVAGTLAITGTFADSSGANEVVAVSISGGSADVSNSASVTRSPISQGQLSLDVSLSSESTVLMLNDGGTLALLGEPTPSDRLAAVKGFIGLPVESDTLLALPVKGAETELDVGEISAVSDELVAAASSAAADTAASLNVDENTLLEVAGTDDIFRHIKNNFANYNVATDTYYKAKPFFNWRASEKNAIGVYLAPADLVARGFGIYFDTNDSRAVFSKICSLDGSANFLNLSILPPSGVTISQNSINYTDANPMSNLGLVSNQITSSNCGVGTLYVQGSGSNPAGFNVGGDGFDSPQVIPAGAWKVKLGSNEVAAFDLAMASPVDGDGNPRIWVPVIRIEKDADNFITAIKAKLFRWDRQTSSYVEVTDLTTFKNSTNNFSVSLADYSGVDGTMVGGSVSNSLESAKRTDPAPGSNEYSWSGFSPAFKVPGTANSNKASAPHYPVAESIVIGFSMNEISFRFDLRVSSP